MKLSVTVCGVGELPEQKGKPWTHVISIWDKALEFDSRCRDAIRTVAPQVKVHFAFFDDKQDRLYSGSPTITDVEEILNFTSELPDETKILIHCMAGVSRSPAIAYAIVCQHSQPGAERAALNYIKSVRPMIIPNELIAEWADTLLKRQGEITRQLGYE